MYSIYNRNVRNINIMEGMRNTLHAEQENVFNKYRKSLHNIISEVGMHGNYYGKLSGAAARTGYYK